MSISVSLKLMFHSFDFLQLEQKHKYATWKAADIRKALSEGRKPLPGPLGGEPAPSSGEYV